MSQLTIQKTSSLLSKLKEFQIISQSLRRYTVKMYGQQLCYCQDSTYDRCRGFNKSIDKSVISSAFSSLNYHFLLIGDVRQTPGRTYATKVPKKEPKAKKGGKPKVILTDEEMSQVINVELLHEHFSAAIERLKEHYIKHLSLRTSVGSIEALVVSYEGEEYPLNQVAQVIRKNPTLLVINVSSFPEIIPSLLDSLRQSGMNLNPQQEGTTVYVPIPQITREHRENLAKNARMIFNKSREELQEIQNKAVKSVKGKKENFSEDLIFNVQQQIMNMTTSYISQAERIFSQKQEDLLGGK